MNALRRLLDAKLNQVEPVEEVVSTLNEAQVGLSRLSDEIHQALSSKQGVSLIF